LSLFERLSGAFPGCTNRRPGFPDVCFNGPKWFRRFKNCFISVSCDGDPAAHFCAGLAADSALTGKKKHDYGSMTSHA
jgi:hypothetical protein